MHYNWHRFYDPNVGRYITPDPIGLAGGLNVYGYVGGDPVNGIDPSGLLQWGISSMDNPQGLAVMAMLGLVVGAAIVNQAGAVARRSPSFTLPTSITGCPMPNPGGNLEELFRKLKDKLKDYFKDQAPCISYTYIDSEGNQITICIPAGTISKVGAGAAAGAAGAAGKNSSYMES